MAVSGKWVPCDLSDTSVLFPSRSSKKKSSLPPFRQDAAQLSLELAASAYDMKAEAWQSAGWRDFSYQVDNTLLTGDTVNKTEGGVMRGVVTDYYHMLARLRLRRVNPISQLRGALRQREKSDTCKAIVMIRPTEEGRYIVAIGFMGTGKRIYDWFSNFRVRREDDMHLGFLQLTEEFERFGDQIEFPQTAEELGVEKLTLNDVISECRRPDSRFLLWMAGHSQGAAVMQIFAWRMMLAGALPGNFLGYGFASPTVTYASSLDDLSKCPVYHLINSDDVTPRVGARRHIGRCFFLPMNDEIREKCYRVAWDREAFVAMLRFVSTVTDTRSGLLLIIGLLRALGDLGDAEAKTILSGVLGKFVPEKMLGALGGQVSVLVDKLARKTERNYLGVTGETALPEESIRWNKIRIASMIDQYGAKEFVQALLFAVTLPHRLRGGDEVRGVAPYQFMVTEGFRLLREGESMAQSFALPVFALRRPAHARGRARIANRFARLSALRAGRSQKRHA